MQSQQEDKTVVWAVLTKKCKLFVTEQFSVSMTWKIPYRLRWGRDDLVIVDDIVLLALLQGGQCQLQTAPMDVEVQAVAQKTGE